jgi:hypothetical protein
MPKKVPIIVIAPATAPKKGLLWLSAWMFNTNNSVRHTQGRRKLRCPKNSSAAV